MPSRYGVENELGMGHSLQWLLLMREAGPTHKMEALG